MQLWRMLHLLAAAALLVGARTWHLLARPEWTGAESLRQLWPLYMSAAVLAVVGLWGALE